MTEFTPDYEVPACETLVEIMRERGISRADLSSALSITEQEAHRLMIGEDSLLPHTKSLERLLGIPERLWRNLCRNMSQD